MKNWSGVNEWCHHSESFDELTDHSPHRARDSVKMDFRGIYRYKQVLSDSFARTAPLLKGFSLCQNFFGRPQENYLGLRTG